MSDYVPLHIHTEFSIRDSTNKIKNYVAKCKEYGYQYASISDHGNMSGSFKFYNECKKNDIIPILGQEFYYFTEDENSNNNYHLILYAKDNKGWENLCKLSSDAYINNFYKKPRTCKSMLSKFSEGLICTPACFLKDELVLTSSGYKEIADIVVGDYVLTHNGRYKEVYELIKKKYNGIFKKIKTDYFGFISSSTEDHKYLVIKKNNFNNNMSILNHQYLSAYNINRTKTPRLYSLASKRLRDFNAQWDDNIEVGDILLYPKNNNIVSDINILDTSIYNNVYESLKGLYNIKTKMPDSLNITNELLFLLGIFCAEGNTNIYHTEFTININETKLEQQIVSSIVNIFNVNPHIRKTPKNNKTSICIYSKSISAFFEDLCGKYSYYKKCPEFIKYLPFEKQKWFLKGCFLGDGHKRIQYKDGYCSNKVSYTTVSKYLIRDIVDILLNKNIVPSILEYDERVDSKNVSHKYYYKIEIYSKEADAIIDFIWNNSDNIDFNINQYKAKNFPIIYNNNEYFTLEVKEVSRTYKEDYVYCFNVKDDHSFVVGHAIVHNCCFGLSQQYLLNNEYDKAVEEIKALRSIFGEDFYLEIANHDLEEEVIIRDQFRNIGNDLNIKTVLGLDSHFTNIDEQELHSIFKNISYNSIGKENDASFNGTNYHIYSPEDFDRLFDKDIINNSLELASKCNVSFKFSGYNLPKYSISDNKDSYEHLKDLCYKGLVEKGLNNKKEYIDRLDFELEQIHLSCLEDYVLIVADYINWAKNNDVPVGPGRGSSAASLVCYLARITEIDPLVYNLPFARFLNSGRIMQYKFFED